jgi:PAS domain-containing protein
MSVTLIEHLPWLCALVATLAALELLRRLRRAQWQLEAGREAPGSVAQALDHALSVGRIGNWHYEWSDTSLAWSDEVFAIYARDRSQGEPPMSEAILAYHPDDRAKVRRAVQRALDHGENIDFSARLRNEAGEMRTILVRGACRHDKDGAITGVLGFIIDLGPAEPPVG